MVREATSGGIGVLKPCLSGCLCGGGRGAQDVTQDGLPESSSIRGRGDSQEKENTRGRWSQVQGEVGEHLRSGVDEDRPREVKTEEGKKSREGPEPAARDCHLCWAWLSLISGSVFRGCSHRESLNRSSGQGRP